MKLDKQIRPFPFNKLATALLMLCVLLNACQPSKPLSNIDNNLEFIGYSNDQQMDKESEIIYLNLLFNNAMHSNNLSLAIRSIEELIKLQPTAALYIEALTLYSYSNDQAKALKTAKAGVKLYPDNLYITCILADFLGKEQNFEEAISLLYKYKNKYITDPKLQNGKNAYLNQTLISMYFISKQYDKAQKLIDYIPAKERSYPIAYYDTQIQKELNNSKEYMRKLTNLTRDYPEFAEVWIMLAAEFEQKKLYKVAAKHYKKALETSYQDQIFLLMINALIKAEDLKSALINTLNSSFGNEIKLQSSLIFMDNLAFTEAKQILEELEDDPFLSDDINFYYALIALDSNSNIPEALERLQDIALDNPNRNRLLYARTLLHRKSHQLEEALNDAYTLQMEYPDVQNNWLLVAEILTEAKEYTKSEKITLEALEQWPDSIALLHFLGSTLGHQKRYAEAIKIMEDILEQEPNDPYALNFIAYTLAEQNIELDRALLLVSKALESVPNNHSIIDSLAWVYYQRAEYQQAWASIQKSISLGGDKESLIWEHYGDIAVKINEKNKAILAYKKSLELNSEHPKSLKDKLDLLIKNATP